MKSIAGLWLALLALAGVAQAQDWPSRPITMVVPYGAGSPADVLGRLLVPRMTEILGQQIVVENVGGAGGVTGVNRVAKAAPDGYQFVLGGVGTHAQSQSLYKNPPYNAATDFAPIGLVTEAPLVLVARKDLPGEGLAGFIAHAKANPMTYGSAGVGSATHLGCALVGDALGMKFTHVPYRGMGPVMQDLTAGRIDFGCDLVLGAKPQIDGGTVKAIAVLTRERSPALPSVPTAQEQGLARFEAYMWNGFFLPKGTPEPIVKRLHAALDTALETPVVRDRLQGGGSIIPPPERRSPEYLARFVESEIANGRRRSNRAASPSNNRSGRLVTTQALVNARLRGCARFVP
jgi:tripartite-type tricarboxylate transporter receptor subunit TctC